MNDANILKRLSETDPHPASAETPASAWSPEVAFTQVEERIATELPASTRKVSTTTRPRWLVAGAALVAVLIVGGVLFATLGDRSETGPVAPVSAPPPPTTAAPQPSAPPQGLPPEAQTLLANLELAYNSNDATALEQLVTPQASLSIDSDDGPMSVLLADRATTASLFEESIRFGECTQLDVEIQCQVTISDRFSETLELEPWIQTWNIETNAGLIERVAVSGESPARAEAMDEFQQYVSEEDPAAPPLLAGTHEWNRTPAVSRTVATHVVGFGALRSGIPSEVWSLVSGLYSALSSGDIAAAEALFAPGGDYFSTETTDVLSAGIGTPPQVVGSPEMREYLTWWHGMLQMDLIPRDCTGNATSVTCTSDSRGIAVLYLPGGTATGTIEFTLGPDGIEFVEDRIRIGATGDSQFDIRGFWRTWMPENAPEEETLWPGGNGDPPGGFTAEFARVLIELYPTYLAEQGLNVPPQYLDGSMLTDL